MVIIALDQFSNNAWLDASEKGDIAILHSDTPSSKGGVDQRLSSIQFANCALKVGVLHTLLRELLNNINYTNRTQHYS